MDGGKHREVLAKLAWDGLSGEVIPGTPLEDFGCGNEMISQCSEKRAHGCCCGGGAQVLLG